MRKLLLMILASFFSIAANAKHIFITFADQTRFVAFDDSTRHDHLKDYCDTGVYKLQSTTDMDLLNKKLFDSVFCSSSVDEVKKHFLGYHEIYLLRVPPESPLYEILPKLFPLDECDEEYDADHERKLFPLDECDEEYDADDELDAKRVN